MALAPSFGASQRAMNGTGLAGDVPSLSALRGQAGADPKTAAKEAARQFESLFMQEMMKSMRQASPTSGMLDNAGTQMGTEMLDKQFAQQMTGMPRGLSGLIERQLLQQMGGVASADGDTSAADVSAVMGADSKTSALDALGTQGTGTAKPGAATRHPWGEGTPATQAPVSLAGKEHQVSFLRDHDAAAKAAEAETGIPAAFMLAQAAHESGWGRREIKNGDGSSAHNVFGIKAGAGWTGPTTEVTTTEVVDGRAMKVKAKFRAYESDEASFRDYAQLMKNSPRYAKVVEKSASAQGFAHGLQRAGYATDPAYADKLTRMINTTLRLQRAMA
jgi:peptidoglycan hydrolase FlgJ